MRRTSIVPIVTAALAITVGLLIGPAEAQAPAAVARQAASSAAVAGASVASAATIVSAKATYATAPRGPYKAGKRIVVTFLGFPKNQTLLLAVCKYGTNLSRGAQAIGDCAPFAGPSSEFARSNAAGAGKGAVTILRGPLKATNWPGYVCGTKTTQRCVLVVSDLSGRVVVKTLITYAR